jgi:site-specific DNA-methyltransferase (adenine-specific)/adenine-specific DNA-methyltransferase
MSRPAKPAYELSDAEKRDLIELCTQAGRYTVAVKVIDIFGNDTMVLVPVSVG